MAIRFVFRIAAAETNLEIPETGFHVSLSGTSLFQHPRQQVGLPASRSGLQDEIVLMKELTLILQRKAQSAIPFRHFLAKLVDAFDYEVWIEGYETRETSWKRLFESGLQAHLRMRSLTINGIPMQIPLWKRNAEYFTRRLLVTIAPYIVIAVAYLNMPRVFSVNPVYFLIFLLLVSYATYYLGKIIWMLVSILLVPLEYRICILTANRSRLSAVNRLFARLFWGVKL